MLFCVRWPVGASNGSGVRCEAGLCVPAAADRASACRPRAMLGLAPGAVQRSSAGTTGRVANAGNLHLLRGPVGPAQRDPGGPAGCGGVVVLVATGDAAPPQSGVRRILPAGESRP